MRLSSCRHRRPARTSSASPTPATTPSHRSSRRRNSALPKKQKLVGLILGMNGLPALGLKAAQGAQIINPFYWDLTDGTRAFAKRFAERHPQNNYPNDMQAGVYASVLHYLKAVDKVGGATDGKAVVAAMKAMPTDDPLFGKGIIRADGRKIHPPYLLGVKSP